MKCEDVARIYNIQDKFLYEILEDYHEAGSTLKNDIFQAFIRKLHTSTDYRQVSEKYVSFTVAKELIHTELGQIFVPYQKIPYAWVQSRTSKCDYANLIMQKINNIYTAYCDKDICLKKEYMHLLHAPQTLYNSWLKNPHDFVACEVDQIILNSLAKANDLKSFYSKQKMNITWESFDSFVIPCLLKGFDNFISLDDFSNNSQFIDRNDSWHEDNFVVSYLCRCLSQSIKNFQKTYYGLYRIGKRSRKIYKRCYDCGAMFLSNKNATKTFRCAACQKNKYKEYRKLKAQKHRELR